jgi:HK97 family phage prohead protease
MIMERAIVQQTVLRDGETVTRECPRPEHVRLMAHRLHRWKETREGCQRCQADNAVSVRGGHAVCGLCKANHEIRYAAYDSGRKPTPFVRASDYADALTGVAIVFNSPSVDLGGFVERVAPSAVDRTFAEGIDVVQLAHHNTEQPLARLSRGTLRLSKTTRGLENSFDPIDTTDGENMRKNVTAGNVQAQSFGFVVMEDDWDAENDQVVRTVKDMRVYELSGVVWPAYRATTLRYVDTASRQAEVERQIRRMR